MSTPIPDNLDALLRREATAEALTAAGYPTKAKTLATKASRGGGPPYRKYGPWPLYRWGDALAWAQSRLSEPGLNSSEISALRAEVATPPPRRSIELGAISITLRRGGQTAPERIVVNYPHEGTMT